MSQDPETWDEMVARTVADEASTTYAKTLMTAMCAYRNAGFSEVQAWELTLAEHVSRLDYMGQIALSHLGDDDSGTP